MSKEYIDALRKFGEIYIRLDKIANEIAGVSARFVQLEFCDVSWDSNPHEDQVLVSWDHGCHGDNDSEYFPISYAWNDNWREDWKKMKIEKAHAAKVLKLRSSIEKLEKECDNLKNVRDNAHELAERRLAHKLGDLQVLKDAFKELEDK